jgi:hypothetical protein
MADECLKVLKKHPGPPMPSVARQVIRARAQWRARKISSGVVLKKMGKWVLTLAKARGLISQRK